TSDSALPPVWSEPPPVNTAAPPSHRCTAHTQKIRRPDRRHELDALHAREIVDVAKKLLIERREEIERIAHEDRGVVGDRSRPAGPHLVQPRLVDDDPLSGGTRSLAHLQ